MRIIAGSHKGRELITPKTRQIRPTTDRLKQIIFDILSTPFKYQRVLDLFAGSGSLGLEALSRGASSATFIDNSSLAIRTISANCKLLALDEKCRIVRLDVFRALSQFIQGNESFDLVLADPPYEKMLTSKLLQIFDSASVLMPGGILVIEHSAKDTPTMNLCHLQCIKTKKIGETAFSFYENRSL